MVAVGYHKKISILLLFSPIKKVICDVVLCFDMWYGPCLKKNLLLWLKAKVFNAYLYAAGMPSSYSQGNILCELC